jgi:hypothetical protein
MMAWFAPMTVETKLDAQIGLYPEELNGGQSVFNAKLAGCAMKNIMVITTAALVACSTASHAPPAAGTTKTVPTPQEDSAAVADTAPTSDGLSDLDAMTFGCPKAALNAAAREAAKVPSQGTYQFAYFKITNASHHASYEIHFKSNYEGEPDLKYCVSMYCQQGWDPKTTKTSVSLMSNARPPAGAAAHGTDCDNKPAPAKRRFER